MPFWTAPGTPWAWSATARFINATAGFTPASVLAGVAAGIANTIASVTTAATGRPTTTTTTASTGTNGQVAGNTANGFSANNYGAKYGLTSKNVTNFY